MRLGEAGDVRVVDAWDRWVRTSAGNARPPAGPRRSVATAGEVDRCACCPATTRPPSRARRPDARRRSSVPQVQRSPAAAREHMRRAAAFIAALCGDAGCAAAQLRGIGFPRARALLRRAPRADDATACRSTAAPSTGPRRVAHPAPRRRRASGASACVKVSGSSSTMSSTSRRPRCGSRARCQRLAHALAAPCDRPAPLRMACGSMSMVSTTSDVALPVARAKCPARWECDRSAAGSGRPSR